jgi:hypothetical protein
LLTASPRQVLRSTKAWNFVFVTRIHRRAGNELMNIEQGMSKEEGRRLSEEMATKKRQKSQRASQADVFESLKSVITIRFVFFLRLFVATTLLPSTFLVRHSSVP